MSFRSVLLAALVAPLACQASVLPRALTPLPPSEDPFYQPPAGFASTAPGTILRNRTITPSILAPIQNAYQLLYRTTAVNGSAIATVTTIFKPVGAQLDRFVQFSTAYDSSDTICDPSWDYQFGSNSTDAITGFEVTFIADYLNAGYIVSSADYEGPDAAFTPGHLEGQGVLDSMRAVSNFHATLGLTTSSPAIVGAGYSGGAIATGWAASLQPKYAPELNIKGWAAGGVPANLTGVLVYIDGTSWSGFLPPSVVGLLAPSAYGHELSSLVNSIATPAGLAALNYASTHCAVDDVISFANKSVLSTTFQSLGYGILYNPTVQNVLNQNIMGLSKAQTPTAPVLIYHSIQDEIIPFANTSTLVNSWCANGAAVNFTVFSTGGHAGTELAGFPYQMDFVERAFAGTTIKSGCQTTTVTGSSLSVRDDSVDRSIDRSHVNTITIAAASDGRMLTVDVSKA